MRLILVFITIYVVDFLALGDPTWPPLSLVPLIVVVSVAALFEDLAEFGRRKEK